MTPLLQLDSLTKSFGPVRALRGVSLDLRGGEVHALLGGNGAGKSTLMKIVTGAHTPDSGTLFIDGKPVTGLDPLTARSLGIACINQQPALFPDLTVAENIALRTERATAFRLIDGRAQRERARLLLARIGARIDPDAGAGSLSMPEQQLVEIASALGAGARIVIMDEPTASLGMSEQVLLFDVIRELRTAGAGVIYITHRLGEIFALADRVTVLRDGESVGTFAVADPGGNVPLDERALIRLMVGRAVEDSYLLPAGAFGDVVLRLSGVGCSVSGIREINLEVRGGEIVAIAGLVGAGRTELARIIFGLTPADAGVIELGGRPVRIGSPTEAVGMGIACLPEDRRRHGIIPEFSVSANVTLAALDRLFPDGWLRPGVEEKLASSSIRDFDIKTAGPSAPVASLSGGNQQKVALARWLATQPLLLILDEPTQGVDVGAKAEIHRLVRRLAGRGLAVLMISSDLPEVLGMADRIAVMRAGTLEVVLPGGSPAEVVMTAVLGQSRAEAAV